MSPRVLVVGIGNVFLSDDGFGVEVSRLLAQRPLPDHVQVVGYGVRGMHLAYDLFSGYDTAITIGAAVRGETPGTLSVTELDPTWECEATPSLDAHGVQPDAVLDLLTLLGGKVGRVLLVACEPAEITHRIGLSEPVSKILDAAVDLIVDLVHEPDLIPAARNPGQHIETARHDEHTADALCELNVAATSTRTDSRSHPKR